MDSEDLECVLNESSFSKRSQIHQQAIKAIKKSRARPVIKSMYKSMKVNGQIEGYDEDVINKYMTGDIDENEFLPYAKYSSKHNSKKSMGVINVKSSTVT